MFDQIVEYFASLNIHILELFGQSECTGPQTFNTAEAWKIGTCGRPMVVSLTGDASSACLLGLVGWLTVD